MAANVVVRSVPEARFTQEVEAGTHKLVGDETQSAGGNDRGPTPYEYLLTALGTCGDATSIYGRTSSLSAGFLFCE